MKVPFGVISAYVCPNIPPAIGVDLVEADKNWEQFQCSNENDQFSQGHQTYAVECSSSGIWSSPMQNCAGYLKQNPELSKVTFCKPGTDVSFTNT